MRNATISIERQTGSMESEDTTLRMPPAEVAVLARLDWNIIARRVFIDPVNGLIGLMSPSSSHELYAESTDEIVKAVADRVGFGAVGLGASRWYGPGVPEKRKAVEADCCFYLGATYEAWYAADLESADARRAFEARTPPHLVVEVERSQGDGNKPGLYREIGVPEMWRLDADRNRNVSVEFLDLQAEGGPRPMDASSLLPLCTAAFVREAIGPAWRGRRAEMRAIIDRAAAEAEAGPAAGMDGTAPVDWCREARYPADCGPACPGRDPGAARCLPLSICQHPALPLRFERPATPHSPGPFESVVAQGLAASPAPLQCPTTGRIRPAPRGTARNQPVPALPGKVSEERVSPWLEGRGLIEGGPRQSACVPETGVSLAGRPGSH